MDMEDGHGHGSVWARRLACVSAMLGQPSIGARKTTCSAKVAPLGDCVYTGHRVFPHSRFGCTSWPIWADKTQKGNQGPACS